jgi:hypothetical protein
MSNVQSRIIKLTVSRFIPYSLHCPRIIHVTIVKTIAVTSVSFLCSSSGSFIIAFVGRTKKINKWMQINRVVYTIRHVHGDWRTQFAISAQPPGCVLRCEFCTLWAESKRTASKRALNRKWRMQIKSGKIGAICNAEILQPYSLVACITSEKWGTTRHKRRIFRTLVLRPPCRATHSKRHKAEMQFWL